MRPSLTLRGHLDGCVVECDGVIVTAPTSFLQASASLRELRAARAFAAETLRHTLSNPVARKDA